MNNTKLSTDELLKNITENFELEIEEIVLDSDFAEKGCHKWWLLSD